MMSGIIYLLMLINIVLFRQDKLQKHQAFEAEISAHSYAITELQGTGEEMISESHYASELIRVRDRYSLLYFCKVNNKKAPCLPK